MPDHGMAAGGSEAAPPIESAWIIQRRSFHSFFASNGPSQVSETMWSQRLERLLPRATRLAICRAIRRGLPFGLSLSVLAFDAFLPKSPGLPSWRLDARLAWQVRSVMDDRAWKLLQTEAVRGRRIEAMNSYLNSWPKGRHAEEALTALDELDDQVWRVTQSEPTSARRIGALETYLKEFPTGRHSAEASVAAKRIILANDSLREAAGAGDVSGVRDALERGAEINSNGSDAVTALLLAAYNGRLSVVQVLLTQGANPNARTADGTTPLMLASMQGLVDIVRLLLRSGADVNARNALGNTALMAAAKYGRAAVLQELLAKGADPNTRNESGGSALMLSIQSKNAEIVKVLLSAKADPCARTTNGQTALNLASATALRGITSLISAASATCQSGNR
jgi:ankyrin repeat protein